MKKKIIFISGDAFLGMVIAAVEVFRKETLGILLGYKSDNSLIVENAIAYQTSDRYASLVHRNDNAHKRIESFLKNVNSPSKIIGDFHSHTQFGNSKGGFVPSKEDTSEMKNGGVYCIIEINRKTRTQTWDYNRNGTMSGTVGDYFIKIAAWYRNGKNGKPHLGTISCPFGLGFNWSYEQIER